MSWINEIKNHTVAEIGAALGYQPNKRGIGCPACRTAQRGRGDRRPPAGLRPDGRGWRCHVCGASGDGADFAAYALVGRRCSELAGLHGAVSAELARLGLINSDEARTEARARRQPLRVPAAPVVVPRRREPSYLTGHQLIEAASRSAMRDHWLRWECRDRGIDPERIEKYGFRALLRREDYPDGTYTPGPDWRRGPGGRWLQFWRLLCPLVDAGGYVRSLRGRHLAHDAADLGSRPKTVAPTGYATRGLCYADPVARAYLRGQRPGPSRWIIAEGEWDFLAWATNLEDQEDRGDYGILGVISGSWSASWTDKILTRGAEVWLRLDPDQAGDAYALQIEREAWSRGATLKRDSNRSEGDDGDRWAAGATLQDLIRGHRAPAEVRAQIRAKQELRRATEDARR